MHRVSTTMMPSILLVHADSSLTFLMQHQSVPVKIPDVTLVEGVTISAMTKTNADVSSVAMMVATTTPTTVTTNCCNNEFQ